MGLSINDIKEILVGIMTVENQDDVMSMIEFLVETIKENAPKKNEGFVEEKPGLFVDSKTIFERLEEMKEKENDINVASKE